MWEQLACMVMEIALDLLLGYMMEQKKYGDLLELLFRTLAAQNFPSITVEGGGEDTDIHIDLKYKNRDGDINKTDFFLDPTGTKYFNQLIYVDGLLIDDTGYNTTSLTSVSLDDDLAKYS